jgi:4a-hydroxytetrahydrobiopterin dehydratase
MSDLVLARCVPCEGGVPPLSGNELAGYLAKVGNWNLVQGNQIEREIGCKDFAQALQLVNEVGKIAETEGHHPNIYLHDWNKVKLSLYTHAIKGLSRNDFILAAKIDVRNI